MPNILRATEMVRKVNADTPAVTGFGTKGTDRIRLGNTLRFHIPYVGGNAILNPKSLIIRGKLFLETPGVGDDPVFGVFFEKEGIQGIFKNMRVMHGDRLIEEITRYHDFATWYAKLHWSGKRGSSLHAPGEFANLGNWGPSADVPDSGASVITILDDGETGHEFAFAPLSAILGVRATKEKFPLCVLNPMEPFVLEFDLDPDGLLMNWDRTGIGAWSLGECYLNADYDMVGDTLGRQLKETSAGISWDIPGLEKHEHTLLMPASTSGSPGADPGTFAPQTSYGGDKPAEIQDRFLIRSNVQAMTRMIHYFKHKGYDEATTVAFDARGFFQYPELTSWQYQIENMPVPDRAMTALIYQTLGSGSRWPRAHFGRIWTTSMKTAGEMKMAPTCGFQPGFELVFDYSKKLPGNIMQNNSIYSMTQPAEMNSAAATREEDGSFFMAYDFTRQVDGGAPARSPWGDGSFRLRGTDFEVILGMNNKLGTGFTSPDVAPTEYTLVVVTLVEYKRRLVIDHLGRFDAYF